MIDRDHDLPVRRQCALLDVARASFYYAPVPIPQAELALMRRLDALHLAHPFAGSRMLRDLLRHEGWTIGRTRVRTAMRRMGLQTLYQRPRTTRREAQAAVFPYLLRDRSITHSNQVWAADITYVPMRHGFVYLFAVIDWASRRVLAHRLSNTLATDFCIEAVEEAIARYGTPQIFNTDQGCQFTSAAFVGLLVRHGIAQSMDGRGCWRDNVFVERLWRTLKYEEVYLKAYDDVTTARRSLAACLTFYNQQRPHQALDGATPDQMYWKNLAPAERAA